MSTQKISIIVPIYKVGVYLPRCIDSILNQSYKNLEIILVDDGSPDSSGQICDEYAQRDKRIIVIHKSNGGVSDARNAGLNICTGDCIGFIDGDDYIHPDMFGHLLARIEKCDADIAQCKYTRVSGDLNVEYIETFTEKTINSSEAIRFLFSSSVVEYVVLWNKLYRRQLFDSVRFPKSKIHEDDFTTYKLFYGAKKIVVTDKVYYYYCQTPNSIIRSGFNKNKIHYADAMEEQILFFREKELVDLYSLRIKKYAQWILMFLYQNRKSISRYPLIEADLYTRFSEVVKLIN